MATAQSKTGKAAPRKRAKRLVSEGRVYINASFNNTMISVTDRQGNTIAQSSAGACNFRGSRKSTPFAAQVAADAVCTKSRDEFGLKSVSVIIKGPGPGREAAVRAIIGLGIKITEIVDATKVPFNGCRPPKRRRV
jgi:small subunit ribosomal protein S11